MSEHLKTVERERMKYGTPLGAEHAFAVSNATAYTWRGEGWGILAKSSGTNWQGYSIDVILNIREQQAVDVLGDSEGAGHPQWSVLAWEDRFSSLWRSPLVPAGEPDPGLPPPMGDLEARVARLERDMGRVIDALRDAAEHLGSV